MRRSRAFYACAASRRSTHLPTPTPSSPRGRDATATTAALRGRHFRKQDGGAAAWVSAARVRWRGRGSRAPGPSRAARGGAGRAGVCAAPRAARHRPSPIGCGRVGTAGWRRGGARFVRCCGRPRLRQPPRPAAWPRGAAPAGAPVPAARAPVTQLKVFRALAVSGAPGFAGRPAPPPPPLPARFALCGLLQ